MSLEIQQGNEADAPVRPTVSQTWLDQESKAIRQAAEIAVPAAEIELAHAYWNGRRETYNSARQDIVANHPEKARDLPPDIQVDEIRIRQQIIEQEQAQDRRLATAR